MYYFFNQGIQLFIIIYGGIFTHLGVIFLIMPNRKVIHRKMAYLLINFGAMCLSGAPSLYFNLKNIPINYIVFLSLIGQAPFGLDFLYTALGLDAYRRKQMMITRWLSVAICILGGTLFFTQVPSHYIYGIGYTFLAFIFSSFLLLEFKNYIPFKQLHNTLRRFFLIVMLNILLILGMMIIQFSGLIDFMAPFWVLVIFSIFGLVVLFFRHPQVFNLLEAESRKQRYLHPRLSNKDAEELRNKIEMFMEKEQPFLDPDLRLSDFAQALNITPHDLSEIINTRFECGYVQFMNTHRIGFSCKLLKKELNKSVLEIAFESGFNSKSVFNKTFKAVTGITPTEYRGGKKTIKNSLNINQPKSLQLEL